MPITANPKATFEIVLSSDWDKPDQEKAIFECKYLTVAEWSAVAELSEKFDKSKNIKERISLVAKIIEVGVCGWKNLNNSDTGKPVEKLEDIQHALTLSEYVELMHAVYLQMPTAEDKKKLDSPSESSTDTKSPAPDVPE